MNSKMLMVLTLLVLSSCAGKLPPRELLEVPIYTRSIININTFPRRDFNGDGVVTASDAHIDIAYSGEGGAYIGIFVSYADYQTDGCYDDAWIAIERIFMLPNTTRRVFSADLYNWWGDIGISIEDEVYPSDRWINERWRDWARIAEIYGCGWSDEEVTLSGFPYTYNPWQDVDPSGKDWITAYSIEILQDYNRDGYYGNPDNSDAWIQISWPGSAYGPIDIWITKWDNSTGQVYSQQKVYHNGYGMGIYWPKVPNDALHCTRVVRIFIDVASCEHDIHTQVEIVIPDTQAYAGDLLAYVLFSEDGVAYESMATDNKLPIEY